MFATSELPTCTDRWRANAKIKAPRRLPEAQLRSRVGTGTDTAWIGIPTLVAGCAVSRMCFLALCLRLTVSDRGNPQG